MRRGKLEATGDWSYYVILPQATGYRPQATGFRQGPDTSHGPLCITSLSLSLSLSLALALAIHGRFIAILSSYH